LKGVLEARALVAEVTLAPVATRGVFLGEGVALAGLFLGEAPLSGV